MNDDGRDVRHQPSVPEAAGPHRAVPSANTDVTAMRDMLSLVRGNAVLILLVTFLSFGAGTAYLAFAPARYIASASLLVDTSSSSVPEEYYIESQTQMMRSDSVMRAVVEQLDLVEAGVEQDDGEFLLDRARAAKRFVGRFVPALASRPDDGDPVQGAVSTLRRNLTITRPAMTPVVSISYNSTDPGRAADIVNTLVDAYTSQRRRDETAGAHQSVAWLAQRLEGLRQQLDSAEGAIEGFRTANNIVGTGANQNLQAEQRLYELSTQLDAARATNQARARSVPEVRGNARDAPMEGTSVGSEIAMLSEGQPIGERRLTEVRLGLGAPGPVPPATGLSDPKGSRVDEERGRDGAYSGDLADALGTQASLEEALEEAARRASEVNRQRSRLRDLEASAEIYRGLYTSMLQRYEEAVQQSLLPASDGAQVLIAARQPHGRSYPRPLLVLAFAGAFGVTLGVGAAVVRVRLSSKAATDSVAG